MGIAAGRAEGQGWRQCGRIGVTMARAELMDELDDAPDVPDVDMA